MDAYDHDNIFAKILRGEIPSHKVYEDDETLVIMDIMPRADGHALVIPKMPSRNILDISDESLAAIAKIAKKIAAAQKTALNADGITLQQFSESAGGQMVFHTHIHVIPRKEGEALKPHTGEMEDNDRLAHFAELIQSAL